VSVSGASSAMNSSQSAAASLLRQAGLGEIGDLAIYDRRVAVEEGLAPFRPRCASTLRLAASGAGLARRMWVGVAIKIRSSRTMLVALRLSWSFAGFDV
jgi:hypothetical protein